MTSAEHFTAAKQSFAVFRPPNRVLVEFTGEDRARFLHNFCTNDIKALAVNSGCEVIFTNIKARAMGHGFVFAGESSHLLDTVIDGLDELLAHLDKYLITDDVEFKQRDDLEQILVTGPEAVSAVADAVQTTEAINPLSQITVGDLHLLRTDCFDQPGIHIVGTPDALASIIEHFGAIADDETYEAIRLEAGFPKYGVDFTQDHLAPEVNRIPQTISYRKGCYLGQEPIARIDALGNVNKMLCRVEIKTAAAPDAGSAITDAEGNNSGSIASAAAEPDGSQSFALAWLKRDFTSDGTELKVGDQVTIVRN